MHRDYYAERLLLQGYSLADFLQYNTQYIVTQGYYGVSIPASALPNGLTELFLQSNLYNSGSYFPQWMNVHYSSGSTLGKFLNNSNQFTTITNYYTLLTRKSKLYDPDISEVRNGYLIQSDVFGHKVEQLIVYSNGNFFSPRKCSSEFDFIDSITPCYLSNEDSSEIYFRNLDVIIEEATSTNYLITLAQNITDESDVYYKHNNVWNRVPAGSEDINLETLTVSIPVTGIISIAYHSQALSTYLSTGYASINLGPLIPLTQFDFWNSFDEIGLLFNLKRIRNESNTNYLKRLKAVYPFLGSPKEDGLKKAISINLDIVNTGYWDGTTTITFMASDSIKNLWISNLDITKYVRLEKLNKVQDLWYGKKGNWDLSYIFHGNSIITPTASGGKVYTNYNDSQDLYVSYKYENYTVNSSGDCITSLTRNSNTDLETYEIMWSKPLSVNTLSKKSFKSKKLLNPDGSPTSNLINISSLIRQKVPITLGYSNWDKAYWFYDNEVYPKLENLPIMLDN